MSLWTTLKGVLGALKPHLRIIVVSAWGSDAVLVDGKSCATPVGFMPRSTIGLWLTIACNLALQRTEDEAVELWNSWCQKGLGGKLVSADRLRDYIFSLTERQFGAMVHVLDWLLKQRLKNAAACNMEKVRSLLLISKFYDSLSSLHSLGWLSTALGGLKLDEESMRSLVRRVLEGECVSRQSLIGPEGATAELAMKLGQVVDYEGSLRFPSRLHREFLLRQVYCMWDSTSDTIWKEGVLKFVRRVIERLDPVVFILCTS